MIRFYRNTLLASILLLTLSLLLILGALKLSHFSHNLYPNPTTELSWHRSIEPRSPLENHLLRVDKELGAISYEFVLDPERRYPYTHYALYFGSSEEPNKRVDLTEYDRIRFTIKCEPDNILGLVMFSFDEKVTDFTDMKSRRVSSSPFSCTSPAQETTVMFSELNTPLWWLDRYSLSHIEKGFALDKVLGFAFVNSSQSPVDTISRVTITNIAIAGKRPQVIVLATLMCIVIWALGIAWLIRNYIQILTANLKERLLQDRPIMAYKKLSIEPQKARDKDLLMRHLATNYNDPELSLESTASVLGVNRTKINEILKEELGYTFTSYLNKLRLTEAARLLSENNTLSVSEIAYTVGYNNASYFNKLFKQEYGCTPKRFKDLASTR